MLVCTSICANYLPKAMILAKTLKQYNPSCKILICLVEREIPSELSGQELFDFIVLAKEMSFANFDKHIFKHSIVEAATSVKGKLFKYMLENFPFEDKFVYLDPDIEVTGGLNELDDLLNHNEIVVTPHILKYEESVEDIVHNEINSLKYGIYNLGFLAVKRGKVSEEFLDWWDKRLELFCFNDIPNGIFTDQKWIDLAPCFFDICVFKHPGYNYAPWNYSTRKMTVENGQYLINGQQLKFIHFSGLDSGANEQVEDKYITSKDHPIRHMRREYLRKQQAFGQSIFSQIQWSYDYYFSGEKIAHEARIVYRKNPDLQTAYNNPFEKSNDIIISQQLNIRDILFALTGQQNSALPIGIYIFGTGKGGRALVEHLKSFGCYNNADAKVKGFFDNNPEKWGTCFEDLPVLQPTMQAVQEKDIILIASLGYANLMKQQLLDMGIPESKIVVSPKLLKLILELY